MGVDPKRPLVGFALVAVLCAVLMTLSVGRGWGGELFHPGKPIANVAAGGHLDRVPSPQPVEPVEPVEVSIPAELSTQPLGVAAGSSVVKKAVSQPIQDAAKATKDTKGHRVADKAERKAAKAERKAAKAAEKAAAKAERDAAKAERDAGRLAAKLARTELRAFEKAARTG